MVKLRNLKGTKDYEVTEKLIQNTLIDIIKEEYEKFGFNPLETPILEYFDILSSKYAGGAEILEETYTLRDNGDRELALRYDLTVPFCRYVGMKGARALKLPFKRYEIGKVFRDGPVKLGRLREFYQCDADVVGSGKLLFDAECLAIMCKIFERLGKPFKIEVNNRKLLIGIINEAGIEDDNLASSIILSIDKLKKIGPDGVKDELIEKGVPASVFNPIFDYISITGDNGQLFDYYGENLNHKTGLKGLEELKTVFKYAEAMNIDQYLVFRPELARGLEIYTGTIFEAFFKESHISSSIGAGGRYDKIIGKFLGKNRKIPAVGFTIGIDVILSDILNAPNTYELFKMRKTAVDAMIIPIKIPYERILPIVTQMRNQGIKCEIYTRKKKGVQGGLGLADYYGIPVTVLIGSRELEANKLTIKDMIKEEQIQVSIEDAPSKIKEIIAKN